MTEPDREIPSELDGKAEIDFEALSSAIKTHGPLRLAKPGLPYIVTIDIQTCMCGDGACQNKLVPIWRTHGVFTMHWLLSQEEVEEYPCLDDLLDAAIGANIIDSRGERLIIEMQADQEFNAEYHDVPRLTCICASCAAAVGQPTLSMQMLLSQLSRLLAERDYAIEEADQSFGDEAAEFTSQVFDFGFAAGRIYSEMSVKQSIEADALEGLKSLETKKKRSKAAGDRSAQDRQARRTQILEGMENLVALNPALVRIKSLDVAKIAADDAAKDSPKLWRQGKGQIEEYLGEIRRGEAGEDLKLRLKAIFPDKPPRKAH
ncbi:hypothetical protein ACFSDD_13240 [Salipiger marinus]|uniref:hypothetical protein n=1 Tax=Salipiger marinus TaxID=555512 RepID=UPI002C30DAF3|nr:hypothetical protein [Salipiger manganoxidans]MEB3418945.1 hypothetical protein [Salipiger manganoxidans]